jgi:hypothetical protein
MKHREFIAANALKAGLVEFPEEFPYCFTFLERRKAQGLKPGMNCLQRHG